MNAPLPGARTGPNTIAGGEPKGMYSTKAHDPDAAPIVLHVVRARRHSALHELHRCCDRPIRSQLNSCVSFETGGLCKPLFPVGGFRRLI
jgi:hypothetical protein